MLLIISGAFGVFQRDACRAVGGFRTTAIGEDMDLIVRMHRHALESGWRYKVAFVADPVCWTEVPSTVRALSSQRARWQNGLADVLWRNRDMTLNPNYGRIGLCAMPYQWIFECLAPLIDVFCWTALAASAACGLLSHRFFLILLFGGYLFSATLSMGSVLVEEMVYRRYNRWSDLFRLIAYCFVEPVLYRPINTIWRLRGLWDFIGGRNSWQLLQRTGFASGQPTATEGTAATATRPDRSAEQPGAACPADHVRPSMMDKSRRPTRAAKLFPE
jgi:cellulose synthase/poly-beta-1,6-N-acetylglucosamine synthase-like glycosyltransferase